MKRPVLIVICLVTLAIVAACLGGWRSGQLGPLYWNFGSKTEISPIFNNDTPVIFETVAIDVAVEPDSFLAGEHDSDEWEFHGEEIKWTFKNRSDQTVRVKIPPQVLACRADLYYFTMPLPESIAANSTFSLGPSEKKSLNFSVPAFLAKRGHRQRDASYFLNVSLDDQNYVLPSCFSKITYHKKDK